MNLQHPFQIGDRIRRRSLQITGPGGDLISMPTTWPDATVTLLHDRGFDYKYDEPFAHHPRMNLVVDGGTCYPEGFASYEPVPSPSQPAMDGA